VVFTNSHFVEMTTAGCKISPQNSHSPLIAKGTASSTANGFWMRVLFSMQTFF
jgi:hypothetical protein